MIKELFFNVLIYTSCLAVFNRYIKYFAIFIWNSRPAPMKSTLFKDNSTVKHVNEGMYIKLRANIALRGNSVCFSFTPSEWQGIF